ESAETAEKATIEFWFNPPSGGEGANCVVENAIDTFNEQSDTVFVNAVANPDTWNATRTALAGGAGPDIVGTPGPSFVYELASAGQLLPLDDFVDSLGWDENIAPWALSLGRVDGKLYSLPDELETLVLYYNKTLFEANGWQPPTTIEELTALAETISAADIIPFAHANAEWRPANEWFVGEFLNHVAGPDKVYQALKGELAWDNPDFVTAINLLNEYQQNGYFMGGLELYYTTTFDEFRTALATGEAAMNIEGTWVAQDLVDVYFTEDNGGNEWDWVPVPSTSGETIFDIGMGQTWSINANAANPQAAAEFLTYYYSPATQANLIQVCGKAPAPVTLEADALGSIDPRIAAIFAAFSEANDQGRYGYTTWTF
ncbi:MAG: extracellular solute-binding protein, partial [Caldilineaceae bacterium]|nr:extracellular solute-binding protein [Caldilineaceae bacterium]